MSRLSSRDPENDPAATLGKTLRRLREAAGITTYAAAASRIGYGQDTVRKSESGAQVPTEDVLHKLLDAYQITGPLRETVADMWKLARRSKGPIPEFIRKYIEAEAEAEFLRIWAPVIIPGNLQTEDYAMETFRLFGKTEDEAADETDARMQRQIVLDGPVHMTVVLHESVLHRQVGTPQVMAEQMTRLLEASQRSNVIIQVVPEGPYFFGIEAQFEIAMGDEITDTMVTYAVEDYVDDRRDVVLKTATLFKRIRACALPAEQSQAIIKEALQQWQSQQ